MGSVVPGWGQARGTVCFCLRLEGTEPQSFTGSLWELRRLLVPADSWVPETRSSWMLGLPLSPPPSTATGPPSVPAAPNPCFDPRRAACPLKSGPADITAGVGGCWPGSRLRGGCRTRLRSAPARCSGDPRPGTPPPVSSSRPDPRLRPHAWPEPQSSQGTPRTTPAVYPSQGLSSLFLPLSLSLPPCLSLSLSTSRSLGLSISPPKGL